MINDKIKALMKLKRKSNSDGAEALGISYYSYGNKIRGKEFTTEDLIKLANLTGTTLAFLDEKGEPIIKFDMGDIKK